jgi:aminopeptidase N
MMVNDISEENMNEAIKLTAHEILHSYFPFFVGCNETKYAWMDEGFTSFGDYMIFSALADPEVARYYYLDGYRERAGTDMETPLYTISKYLKKPVYWHNSYPKAAAFFMVLYDLFGADGFKESLHMFYERWERKHPVPHDFFHTLMDVHQTDLNWLIDAWFFQFGWVDLGIDPVDRHDRQSVTIINHGGLPVPVHLKIIHVDGQETIIRKTAEIWKTGNKTFEIPVPDPENVMSLELLNPTLIDANGANNMLK